MPCSPVACGRDGGHADTCFPLDGVILLTEQGNQVKVGGMFDKMTGGKKARH
jgi:hypothetical protein